MDRRISPSPVIVSVASEDVAVSDEIRRAMHDVRSRASFAVHASTLGQPVPAELLRAIRLSVLRVRH